MIELVKQAYPEIEIDVEPSPGGQANVRKLAAGKADLALTTMDQLYDAVNGTGAFKEPIKNVYYTLYTYPSPLHIAVLADVPAKSIRDLKGKSVALPPRGSPSIVGWELVIKAYGMKPQDHSTISYGSISEIVELMKNRQAEATFILLPTPASFMLDLGSSRKVRLLSLDEDVIRELGKVNKGYIRHVIPAGTYKEQGHPEEALTVQIPTGIIARQGAPDEAIYKFVKTVIEKKDQLDKVIAVIKQTKARDMGVELGLPYHPGALKYFKEAGMV
jgi:TRAP transporter TAXI family solute receptor